jgi:integrase
LHLVVAEHLRGLGSFHAEVFPWPHCSSTLYRQMVRIQQAAGIHLDCHEKHDCTDACHAYGFHDLRRAFATVNAETLSGDALQKLMRHKSYSTTQRYINMADHLNRSVETLHVPEVLRVGAG